MGRPSSSPSRYVEVLHAIVEAYIRTGEPVGSATIAKLIPSTLSPASIRNVMATLCDEGYLAQPHTSAGRIPTEKAFRSYAQSLHAARVVPADILRIRTELTSSASMEDRLACSSRLISVMTRRMGIVAAIPTAGQILSQMELICLADQRVLMVVATADGRVQNRVVNLPQAVSQDELNLLRNYINQEFRGWVLARIRTELQRRFAEERAAFDELLRNLRVLYEKGLLDLGLAPDVHVEGASTLIGLDLDVTADTMRDLFGELEQKQKILVLLDRFLEQPSGAVAVQVGLGDVHPSMQSLALIGVAVTLPIGLCAKVAVLGPMRMDYCRAMAAVQQVGQAFQGSFEAVA